MTLVVQGTLERADGQTNVLAEKVWKLR